jgi:hypothetical protein
MFNFEIELNYRPVLTFRVKQRDHFCKNIGLLFNFSPLVHIFAKIRAKICARQEQMHAEE